MDLGLNSPPAFQGRRPSEEEIKTYQREPEKLSAQQRQEIEAYLAYESTYVI